MPRLHFEEYGFSNQDSVCHGMNGLVSKNSTGKRAIQGRNNTVSPISSKMLLSTKVIEMDQNHNQIGMLHNSLASSTKRTKSSCSGKNNTLLQN